MAIAAGRRGATGQSHVHLPSHRHGEAVHRTGGGGATALVIQRPASWDLATALVTVLRVAVHGLGEQYPNGQLSVTNN